jgi:hypothetical protein
VRQKKVEAVHPNGPRAIEVNRPYLRRSPERFRAAATAPKK